MASDYIGGGIPSNEDTQPHTAVSELPPPITTLQAPASNAGSDDPSGGIAKEAGGLSSTAGIGSPVPNTQQTVVGSVLESVFGKKERTAEEVEATAPTTASVTTSDQTTTTSTTSPGVIGALAGAAAAGGAAVASIIPSMSAQAPEAQVAPSSTETPGTKTKVAESTTAEEVEATKQSVGAEKGEAVEHEQDPQAAEEEKKKADHAAAVRENTEAIPTAGGEKLGTAHAGESKVIPADPGAPTEGGVSSAAGQPDAVTADNTAKNTTGAAAPTATTGTTDSTAKPKTKFTDRVKKALHIGDKKDKA